MADETPGRVTATLSGILDDIREGAETEIVHPDDECGFEAGGSCTPHAALALVAAVEAALKHHRRIPDQRGVADGPPRPPICEGCRIAWPCPEVAAVTAALTGEEAGDGG